MLALTADEEGGDFNGVDWLREEPPRADRRRVRAQRGRRRRTCGSGKLPRPTVQASEKVYQDFRLEVEEPRRPQLAAAFRTTRSTTWPRRSRGSATDFPVQLNEVTRGLSSSARRRRSEPTSAADMRAVAAADAAIRPRRRAVGKPPSTTRMLRTTCVATRLEGGHANNALPQLATANVNCRILPGERRSR